MTETEVEKTMVDTIKGYIFSKRMIYLVTALVLCIGIYYYMNRKSKSQNIAEEKLNINNQPPEIVFSQELAENIYRNNSNPIQYLIQLQQEGQIPKGPLPKIVIDNSITNQQYNLNQIPQKQPIQETQHVNQINVNNEKKPPVQISYNENTSNIENNDNSTNHYQRIEEDDDDSIIDHQLTKEEIARISNSVLNKN
jgi:hypothetical protein